MGDNSAIIPLDFYREGSHAAVLVASLRHYRYRLTTFTPRLLLLLLQLRFTNPCASLPNRLFLTPAALIARKSTNLDFPTFFYVTCSNAAHSNGFIAKDYRLMASSLVEMGAADGEVKIDAFAFDIERVVDRLLSMEARVDTTAVIDEQTGRVSYGTSVDVDQEVRGARAVDV